jgi:hypothetical protein
MYIYNVTVNIEEDVHLEWLEWMKTTHIPDVMNTQLFLGSHLFQVMVDEEQGITYSVQYQVKDIETLRLYQEVYAQKLQKEHLAKFGEKFVAFRTILRQEHSYS